MICGDSTRFQILPELFEIRALKQVNELQPPDKESRYEGPLLALGRRNQDIKVQRKG
jgi:hypothetical protein